MALISSLRSPLAVRFFFLCVCGGVGGGEGVARPWFANFLISFSCAQDLHLSRIMSNKRGSYL